MPHRDDLEAAHARIAALERDKARLEAQLAERDEDRPEALVPARPAEITRVDNRSVVDQLVVPRPEVGDREIIDAIEDESGMRGVVRSGGELRWDGYLDGRLTVISASRRSNGLQLHGEFSTNLTAALWAVAGTVGGALIAAFGSGIGFWLTGLLVWLAGLGLTFYRGQRAQARANRQLEAIFERVRRRLESICSTPRSVASRDSRATSDGDRR